MENTALITGASSGIGKELAYIHAEKTGDLVVVARSLDKLEELKKDIAQKHKRKVKIIIKDLSDPNSAKEIYDEVKSSDIEIRYLINNAGFGGHGLFHERSWEKDHNMINLNIVALTALTKLFLPDFVKRNNGKILNVSSTASLIAGPYQAVYYATKAYVTSLTRAIHSELEDTNVTITGLLPGATKTEFAKEADLNKTEMFKDAADPHKVALDGYNAMIDGKLEIISGLPFVQKILLKLLPFLPEKFKLNYIKNMQKPE